MDVGFNGDRPSCLKNERHGDMAFIFRLILHSVLKLSSLNSVRTCAIHEPRYFNLHRYFRSVSIYLAAENNRVLLDNQRTKQFIA